MGKYSTYTFNFKKMIIFKNIYSVVIGLLPILSIYRGIFNIAEMGTILLILFSPIILLKFINHPKISFKLENILLLLLIIDAGASILFWGKYSSESFRKAILTYIIFSYCLFVHVLIGINNLFIRKVAIKTIQFISLLSAVLVFVQYIAYYLFNSFINIHITKYLIFEAQTLYSSYLETGLFKGTFRPAGIFLEPSHATLSSTVALLSLLIENNNVKNYKTALIISLGLILTTSGMGIIMTGIIWCIYFLYRNHISLKTMLKTLAGILFGIIFIVVLYKFEFFRFSLSRIFTGNIRTSALYARIYNFQFVNAMYSKWLGNGFGNLPESIIAYNSGVIKILYGQGIIGAVLMALTLISLFLKKNRAGKILVLCIIGLFFVAEMYSTIYLTFFLMFLFSEPKRKTII